MMSLVEFIFREFNQKADIVDKIKVILYTIIDTTYCTIMTTIGITTFFEIQKKSFLTYIILVICAVLYYRLFKFWFIGIITKAKPETL